MEQIRDVLGEVEGHSGSEVKEGNEGSGSDLVAAGKPASVYVGHQLLP